MPYVKPVTQIKTSDESIGYQAHTNSRNAMSQECVIKQHCVSIFGKGDFQRVQIAESPPQSPCALFLKSTSRTDQWAVPQSPPVYTLPCMHAHIQRHTHTFPLAYICAHIRKHTRTFASTLCEHTCMQDAYISNQYSASTTVAADTTYRSASAPRIVCVILR